MPIWFLAPIAGLQFPTLKWLVYRSCIARVSTEVVCIQKLSQRREEPVRRLLCLTEATLVERDPATYNLITLRPLSMVAALVRPKERETKLFIFIWFRYFFVLL
jgi:DnaJ family protein C protein 13